MKKHLSPLSLSLLFYLFMPNLSFSLTDQEITYYESMIKQLDEQIDKLENSFQSIGSREMFKKKARYFEKITTPSIDEAEDHLSSKGIRDFSTLEGQHGKFEIHKFFHVENCILGVATEFYNENKELVKVEEGPIDLRKVRYIKSPEYLPGKSLGYRISFDTKHYPLPDLYFQKERHRTKAVKKITQLMHLCRQRYQHHKLIHPEASLEQVELSVHEAQGVGSKPVRTLEEDSTQKIALLSDGKYALAQRLKTAEAAQSPKDSIKLQTLIFMADEAGIKISDELIKRRQMGVDVNVYVDALSSFMDVRDLNVRSNTPKMYHNMMASGIPVHGYSCSWHQLGKEIQEGVKKNANIINHRAHEKLWIVNNNIAIIGGLNVGNDYFRINRAGFSYWRDQDVLVEGKEIVQDMVNIFEANVNSYNSTFKNPKSDTCFNPHDPVKDAVNYMRFYMSERKDYDLHRSRSANQDKQAYALANIKDIERDLRENTNNALVHFKPLKKARVVQQRPKIGELYIENTMIDLINNAKKEVLISNSYFIPSQEVKKALRRASQRGVDVKILTNSYETNDVPPVAVLARHNYRDLVDFNYSYKGDYGKTKAIELYEWSGDENGDGELEQGTNHSKFMVADRRVAFVGSYNLDPRSRNINSEVGIAFEDEDGELTEELAKTFIEKDLKLSKRIYYRQILNWHQPLDFIRGLFLKFNGYKTMEDLDDITKHHFFYLVAKANEGTW
jgi:putative cardiolipin synthase